MLQRCFDSNFHSYANYGGRGITVGDRWKCYASFLDDLCTLAGYEDSDRDTLDRIDNEGNYEPSHCRWASRKVQAGNRREKPLGRSYGKMKGFVAMSPGGMEFRGKNQSSFASEHGLNPKCISACLHGKAKRHKGWSFRYV
jgi:hypothetical protein